MATKPEPTGLLQAIKAAQATHRHGSKCAVDAVLSQLDEVDANGLRQALADETLTVAIIGRTLRSLGHKIGDDSLRRHRRGVCLCESR